jgi:tetratricopeptide (TPR) repeat protein
MMNRHDHLRLVARAVLAALALALAPLIAHADVTRTGAEPWYQESTPEARAEAHALFLQAVDKHQQLLRRQALELYEQALVLWDNPDIRWNLALELEDIGEYQRAHEQLERVVRWGAALGVERLREVQDRMQALATQRLARIEADGAERGAEATLDGQPWFQGVGQHTALVLPGTHYIAVTKPGYFPVTVHAPVLAGERYHVTLRMTADQVFEIRRWSAW